MKELYLNIKKLLWFFKTHTGLVKKASLSRKDCDRLIAAEVRWLSGIQRESGAIPMTGPAEGSCRIVPYYSSFAALGMLEMSNSIPNVRKYMDWYLGHLNKSDFNGLSGTVYDYEEDASGKEKSLNTYDSVDSYAALFIILLRRYVEVSGDRSWLVRHQNEIMKIGNLMVLMQDKDGLTWAKPDHKVKYLMDNMEVQLGFRDMEWLCGKVFDNPEAALFYKSCRMSLLEGVERKLWDWDRNIYHAGIESSGKPISTDWVEFYPSAAAQLFPIWTEMLQPDSERAQSLYRSFNIFYPAWNTLKNTDPFPWALAALTAAVMGDDALAGGFLLHVEKKFMNKGHPWPWYCMEAGVSALTAAYLSRQLEKKE